MTTLIPVKTKAPRILPLTSLRFAAALYVLSFHTAGFFLQAEHLPLWVLRIQQCGYVGVSFFFTLSGYILAVVYLRPGEPVARRRFWINRFARIYPLFLVMLVFDAPRLLGARIATYGAVSAVWKTGATFLGNCLMLNDWIPRLQGLNDPGWSVAVEAFFYLLFPYLGIVLWRSSARRAVILSIALYAAGIAASGLAGKAGMPGIFLRCWPIFHLHEFLIGLLAARIQEALPRDTLRRAAPLIAGVAAVAFFAVLLSMPWVGDLLLNAGVLLPVFVAVILAFASGNKLIEGLFSTWWLVILGEASYGLYLIHLPFWHLFEAANLDRDFAAYPAYLALSILASIASLYLLETPARAAILKLGVRSPESSVAASLAQ